MQVKNYKDCATRLETRGYSPPKKEYVDGVIKFAKKSGVEGFWHSAVDPSGRPLFPSKVFPNFHKDANFESFRYLIDNIHKIGRPVLSWYPLRKSIAVFEDHPDWALKPFEVKEYKIREEYLGEYLLCFNSPYGEMLPKFFAEVIRELGFDGMWLDGNSMDNYLKPGCSCDFCQDRFKKEIGLEFPDGIDYEDKTFRIWMRWRYEVLFDLWKRIISTVKVVKPDVIICLNNLRRPKHCPDADVPHMSWATGIPLRSLNLDCVMSGEIAHFPYQADFQIKMHKAYNCKQGTETWMPLAEFGNEWVPDVDPLAPMQAAIGAVCAGGALSCGSGTALKYVVPVMKKIQEQVKLLRPYVNGKEIEYISLLVSQNTIDYYGKWNDAKIWKEWFGANEICKHSHLMNSIIFDNSLEQEDLKKYPIIVLGNCVCITKKQAERLEQYVSEGGLLFCNKDVGILDELGFPYKKPILDKMIGIKSRKVSSNPPTLEFIDDRLRKACGEYLSFKGPIHFGKEDHILAEPTSDVKILANVVDRDHHNWDEEELNGGKLFNRYPGLWSRKYGKGTVIYTGVNFFFSYLYGPVPAMAKMFSAILTRIKKPPITIEGPMCVNLNARFIDNGKIAVLLHNVPGSIYAYPTPPGMNFIELPGEVNPIYNVKVIPNAFKIEKAFLPLKNQKLKIEKDSIILVPEIKLYEVVEIHLEQ